MRGAYAIARHEFLRRWPLSFVGLALGVLACFVAESESPKLVELAGVLTTIAVVVCWVIAFTTGMQLIGRPLHDGRLSFYFTRPISSAGIAVGKTLGGLVALVCMHVALVMPLGGSRPDLATGSRDLAEAATFVGIAFFVVGLVVGILARSRSRWFLVDMLGAAVAAVVAVLMFAGLGDRRSAIAGLDDPGRAALLLERADTYLYMLVVVAAVALVASVVVAITRGRTDRDLVHRNLSVFLWPALLAVGIAGIGLARWGLQ